MSAVGGVVDGRAAAREEDPAVLLDLPHGEQHDVVARCDPGVLTVEGAEVLIVNVELRGVEALVEDRLADAVVQTVGR